MIKKLALSGLLLGALICPRLAFSVDYSVIPLMPFGPLNDTDNPLVITGGMAQDLLNVDLSPGGRSIIKREGYALQSALTITTSAVHGIHNFYDANGADVQLYFNDGYISASISGNTPSVILSTQSLDATWQCVDSQGSAYCVSTARPGLLKTNGLTYSWIAPVSTGSVVALSPTRMALAGLPDYPNRIDFSASVDFTDWVVDIEDTDPITFTIVSPGAKITHVVYAFGKFIWFKETSFGFVIEGETLDDWMIQVISPNVGTIDNTSVYYYGVLYFRGNDSHLYAYDGANLVKLTEDVSTVVEASQSKLSNSWTQTSYADFTTNSSMTAVGCLTVSQTGSIFLSTDDAQSFVDTSSADFVAGTLTRLSTAYTDGSLVLGMETSSSSVNFFDSPSGSGYGSSGDVYQSFTSSDTQYLKSISVRVKRVGSPGTGNVLLLSDNSVYPGTLLAYKSFDWDTVGTAAFGWHNIDFGTQTILLLNGTKYWVGIEETGASDYVWWDKGGGTPAEYYCLDTTGDKSCAGGRNNNFQINYYLYAFPSFSSGTIVSQTFDVGLTTNYWTWEWGNLNSSGLYETPNSTITYEVQTSSASTGPWDSIVSEVSSGTAITNTVQRYIRYVATFTWDGTSAAQHPRIDDVSIYTSSYTRPTGIYYSATHETTNITSWDSFASDYSENDGTLTFYVRASTSSFTINSATPTWVSISNGDTPAMSTGTLYQARVDFDVAYSTQEPTLNGFTQNWFEGAADDKTYATYFDDAIWWAITTGAGATYNNRVMVYDLINKGFTVYDIAANGFLVRNKILYFGSSLVGKIFKFGGVDSDDGSAIEAYWQSKNFSHGLPFQDKDLVNVSVAADSVDSSTVTVTYVIGSTTSAYAFPLNTPGQEATKHNKNIQSGIYGQTMSFKIGNDAVDQPFEIFGIQIGVRPRAWRPTQ